VDYSRLQKAVDSFVEDINAHLWAREQDDHGEAEDRRQSVVRRLPGVQAIAAALAGAPDPADFEPEEYDLSGSLDAGLRLQGVIDFHRDVADALRNEGPSMDAERLHIWVWEAARTLWVDGHHRQAVHAAASQIDHHLQAKLGRYDVSGTRLAREAFSLDPPVPGRARLRFQWVESTSETFRSVHEGARDFGAAAAQLIRNTAAHSPLQVLSDNVALEHLACLSLWARLIERASVIDAPMI
jgi:uncharacterized protein (TIGR02391 family)